MLRQRFSALNTYIIQRIILIITGWIAAVLDTLGVVLPLLPTMPFILLAVWYSAHSSSRLHNWLLYRSWFDGYSRHWQEHRAMPPGAKLHVILLTLVTFSISLWLVNMTWMRGLPLVILVYLLIFVWRIPMIDEKQQKQ